MGRIVPPFGRYLAMIPTLATLATVARAAEAAPDVACPTRAAVEDAARALLNRSSADRDIAQATVEIRDLGQRYVVSVLGKRREYTDETRDCDARARAAAVFVALTLAPSNNVVPEPPVPPPAVPPAPSPPVPPALPPLAITVAPQSASEFQGTEIEVGASGAMAPRTDGSQFVLAADLRFIVTRGAWGLALGGSLPTSSTLDLQSARVRQTRYPIDLGVRRVWDIGWFHGGLELGALAAICQMGQSDRPRADDVTRIELGLRAAAILKAESPRIGLYLRVFSELLPMTQEIAVEPRGVAGRTSAFWAGVSVGVTARFH